MKKFKKVYVEITNICNLNCSFCPKTTRKPKFLTPQEFEFIAKNISPLTDFVNLHLMGEPLLHPNLKEILEICKKYNLKPSITTNGTLLKENLPDLLKANLFKLTISLHSFEAQKNVPFSFEEYLENAFLVTKEISKTNTFVELRLWNLNGQNQTNFNKNIINKINQFFSSNLQANTCKNTKIAKNLYLNFGDKWNWPVQNLISKPIIKSLKLVKIRQNFKKILNFNKKSAFCYALRTHFGILSNGDVVPCCLDNNGSLKLGNIFETDINAILNCPLAKAIYNGFSCRKAVTKLCKHCSFIKKFN